jgi:hypothetical protein
MSEASPAAGAARWTGSLAARVVRAWRVLPPERRLAAGAAVGLFVTLFLPWYQLTVFGYTKKLQSASASLTGWGAFSFVEAAVLLVAVGVLVLLIQRAEGRAFHVPGGDGFVIMAAGLWTCVLIIWRIFDKQGTETHGQVVTTSGIEWGIFVALVVAAVLAYAGSRIRAIHVPEPPLPGEERRPVQSRQPVQERRRVEERRPVQSRQPVQDRRPVEERRPAQDRPAGPSSAQGASDPTLRYEDRPAPPRRARPAPSQEQLTIPLEREE